MTMVRPDEAKMHAGSRALGIAALRRGDAQAALDAFDHAVECAPDDADAQQGRGAALLALGHLAAAKDAYAAAVTVDPTRVDALRGLGHAARRLGDHMEALRWFEAACVADGRGAKQHHEKGEVLRRLGRLREAAAAFTSALSLQPDHRPSLEALVSLARGESDRNRAREWLEVVLAAEASNSAAGLALADLYRISGELDRAASVLERLASSRPDDAAVWAAQGRLARLRGQHALARHSLEQAYGIDPLAAVIDLASVLRDAGAYDEALARLEAVRAGRPDTALLVQLGVTARAAGDNARALRYFDAALDLDPDHVSAMIEVSATLLRLGELGAMRALLERATTAAPNHPRVLDAQADLALMEDDPGTALAIFRQGDASSAAQASKRARCTIALGQVEEGLQTIDAAIATWGPSFDLLLLKAQTLRQRGRLAEAKAVLDEGVARFPDSFAAWFHRTLLIAETGDASRADLGPSPAANPADHARASTLAGVAATSRWLFARASSHFRRALDVTPADAATRARLSASALLNFDLGETEEQLRCLAKIEGSARRLRGQSVSPFKTLVGQILEEAKLDPVALGRLGRARRTCSQRRCDALAVVVRDYPEMTLAAMQLLVALRRQGRFDDRPPLRDARIPRAIVQFWHVDDPPADVLDLTRSWTARNEGFAYTRFSDRSAIAFLRAEYPPEVSDAYGQARDPARKADLFRLAYLARHGGIYADADDRCLAPLDPLLSGGGALVVYQEDIGSVGNDVIAATPGHPAILRALDGAVASLLAGDNDIPWLATGPGLLSRVVASMAAEGGAPSLEEAGLRLVTRRALVPYVAVGCAAAYKHTRRHWMRAAFQAPPAAKSA